MAHWAIQSGILDSFMKGALSSLANGEAFATKMLGRQDQGLGILSGNGLHRNAEVNKNEKKNYLKSQKNFFKDVKFRVRRC